MTNETKHVIKETFENVKSYFEHVVKVDRLLEPFQLHPGLYPISRPDSGDTDLFVTLYPRPYGPTSAIMAAASPAGKEADTGRTIQGLVFLNLAVLPFVPSNYSTIGNRNFFEIVLHEVTHILAVSNACFMKWIDKTTGKKYDPMPKYTLNKLGKTFTIIHTPKLHQVMAERWGIEYFDDNPEYPVGIEIEEGGGSGTMGSHWDNRMVYNEIMSGINFGTFRITNITLAAFEDSGWYDIDYSMTETLEWGDYRSLICSTEDKFYDFPIGAPAKTWPDHYVIKRLDQIPASGYIEDCTYDHRSIGYVQATPRDCGGSTSLQCQYPEFYDANELGYYGTAAFDYSLVVRPRIPCIWDTVVHPDNDGSYFGDGAMCAWKKSPGSSTRQPTCFKMMCYPDNVLAIFVGEESRNCSYANEELTFSTIDNYVVCPNPLILCGILNYNQWQDNLDPKICVTPTPTPTPTPSRSPTPTPTPTATPPPPTRTPEPTPSHNPDEGRSGGLGAGAIAGIVIAVLLILGLVPVVVMLLLQRMKQTEYKEAVSSTLPLIES